MLNGNDPVELGFAQSLAHPGGNITGLVRSSPELIGKNLELLAEAVPGVKRIGVLFNPSNRAHEQSEANLAKAAGLLGLQYQIFYAREAKEIEPAIKSARTKRMQALLVMGDGMYFQRREQIAALALAHRLPSSYANTEHVEAGGLLSYSPSSLSNYRRGASFVDKILRGAKPGDIPIEQPAKLDLAVNVKTARALGLAIPQSILLRADQVVE